MSSTSSTLWISMTVGVGLVTFTLLLGWMNIQYNINGNFLKWLILPTLGYGLAFILNTFIQRTTCGSTNLAQIAKGSITVPLAMFGFLLLTLLQRIRSPVEVSVPPELRARYGGIFAIAFYMFWAGMFGESVAAGLAQSCPK